MLGLSGYEILEPIYENNRIKVFKGYAAKDRIPVIIKVLKEDAASPAEIASFRHEYAVMRKLNVEGIIKYLKLKQVGKAFAIIIEDTGAVSLKKYIKKLPVSLPEFLDIALSLTEAVGSIHKTGVIHRDLKPEHIFIHPDTLQAYVVDFKDAVLNLLQNGDKLLSTSPVGSLEYMPPEQTGRLNIPIDKRSDLYPLGVIFYELLTGKLPLQAHDPLDGYMHILL